MSLNTTPRTFVTGEVETAAIFNAEVRDALTGIQAAWTSYVPALTNITLGNGTVTAAWSSVGKTVIGRARILAGSTTTYAAGNLGVDLPAAFNAGYGAVDIIGSGHVDNGAGASRRLVEVIGTGTKTANFAYEGASVTNTTPFAFGTGSRLAFAFTYETT